MKTNIDEITNVSHAAQAELKWGPDSNDTPTICVIEMFLLLFGYAMHAKNIAHSLTFLNVHIFPTF